jgi:hypothetical protein
VEVALLALGEAGALAGPSGWRSYAYRAELDAGLASGIVPRQVPLLLGRARVDLTFQKKPSSTNGGGADAVAVGVVLDGLAAPLACGSTLNLVQRGFYSGLPVDPNVVVASEAGPPRTWDATVRVACIDQSIHRE